jgi:hypothetical protein
VIKPWPIEEHQEPPDDTFPPEQPPVLVPAALVSSVLETLSLLDEFFRDHTSSTARAELAAFAALHGWVPGQGAQLVACHRDGTGALPRPRDHLAALVSMTKPCASCQRTWPRPGTRGRGHVGRRGWLAESSVFGDAAGGSAEAAGASALFEGVHRPVAEESLAAQDDAAGMGWAGA